MESVFVVWLQTKTFQRKICLFACFRLCLKPSRARPNNLFKCHTLGFHPWKWDADSWWNFTHPATFTNSSKSFAQRNRRKSNRSKTFPRREEKALAIISTVNQLRCLWCQIWRETIKNCSFNFYIDQKLSVSAFERCAWLVWIPKIDVMTSSAKKREEHSVTEVVYWLELSCC